MVQNCSLGVRVGVGQRDETRGRSRYPPFGKKFPKFFGGESGLLLGGFRSEKLDVVRKHSRSWPSEASQIPGDWERREYHDWGRARDRWDGEQDGECK